MWIEIAQTRDFAQKFSHPLEDRPIFLTGKTLEDRAVLIAEELRELTEATNAEDQLDALIDLLYVTFGTLNAAGMHEVAEEAFSRVHTANMNKERGTKPTRPDMAHDAVKPPGWTAPDLSDLVEPKLHKTGSLFND